MFEQVYETEPYIYQSGSTQTLTSISNLHLRGGSDTGAGVEISCVMQLGNPLNIVRPGWDLLTGRFLGQSNSGNIGTLTTDSTSTSRLGQFFAVSGLGYRAVSRYSSSGVFIESITSVHWHLEGEEGSGTNFIGSGAFDPESDRVVMHFSYEANDEVGVYEYASGTRLGGIRIPGRPFHFFWGPPGIVYVISDEGIISTINYDTFQLLGISRIFGTTGATHQNYQYDNHRKLLLFIENTPDNQDGSSTVTVQGYTPIPIPVALGEPIPARAPKLGRTIPVVTRAYGDAGEPISNVVVEQTSAGPGVTTPSKRSTNGNGFASFNCACDGTGLQQTDIEATV